MIKYFTFRNLCFWNYFYSVNYSFDNELNTIKWLKYEFVCDWNENDNRKMWYFEYNWELSDTNIIEIIQECLNKYSLHFKTIESAQTFIIESFWTDNIENISIIDNKIDFKLKNNNIL